MAEYKGRRARKRAAGGATEGEGKGPPHGHMLILIGIAPKKPKKAGDKVAGKAARKHLGKRARGGPAKRADGGSAGDDSGDNWNAFMDENARQNALDGDKSPTPWSHEGRTSSNTQRMGTGTKSPDGSKFEAMGPARRVETVPMSNAQFQKQARGGHVRKRERGGRTDDARTLDAREDANDPDEDGRDKVSQRSGTEERAVEMGDPRARGGRTDKWIQGAREGMEKHGTKGALHRQLHVPGGEKIPERKLEAAKGKAERSGDTKTIRRITFAENVRRK